MSLDQAVSVKYTHLMRKHIIALAISTAIIAVYTFHWFYPTPQLLVTPDFGHSDAWHFSFVTKWYLGKTLHEGTLPLWTSGINTGFPLFAEGQTGMFFLPNLVAFKFFDPVIAYNTVLALVLATAALGMYWWLMLLGTPWIAATALALTLAFSGLTITQLSHITLLQGFTLMPAIMACTHLLAHKKQLVWALLFAILLSQQILTGFPQAFVITLLFAGPYFLFLAWGDKKKIGDSVRFSFAIILALSMAAIQLLPSREFLSQSSLPGGFPVEAASQFSFLWKHLITFIDPFALGNPKLGSYPAFTKLPGSIFWENSGFVGTIPIFLALLLLFTRPKKSTSVIFFAGVLVASLLLMTGKHSPLYFIYSIWPLTLFRVPSRFIWIFTITILVLAAASISHLWKKRQGVRIALSMLLFINLGLLLHSYSSYQSFDTASLWLQPPTIVTTITPRVYTIAGSKPYNDVFLTRGWTDITPYRDLRNLMDPNQNLYWNIPHADVYAGRSLYRSTLFQNLLTDELHIDETIATPSAAAARLLALSGVGSLVSAIRLDQFTWNEATVSAGTNTLYIYTNPTPPTRTYIANNVIVGKSLEDAKHALTNDVFDPTNTVMLENEEAKLRRDEDTKKLGNMDTRTPGHVGMVTITRDEAMKVVVEVKNNPADAYLVLTDTYYPGWIAEIDVKPTDILPANIMHRAVSLPPGDHVVTFTYKPASFQAGRIVSTIAHLCGLGLGVFLALAHVFGKPR